RLQVLSDRRRFFDMPPNALMRSLPAGSARCAVSPLDGESFSPGVWRVLYAARSASAARSNCGARSLLTCAPVAVRAVEYRPAGSHVLPGSIRRKKHLFASWFPLRVERADAYPQFGHRRSIDQLSFLVGESLVASIVVPATHAQLNASTGVHHNGCRNHGGRDFR